MQTDTGGSHVNDQISKLIGDFDGHVAFLARNLGSLDEIAHESRRVMPTASTIKLLVLAELFRQADAGQVRLDDPLPLTAEDRRGGSGILKDLSPDVLLSHDDHATLMIALSDNTSTAALVRVLGRERILASAAEWGMVNTTAGFRVPEGGNARDYAASTPRDIVALLQMIANDAFISPAACARMRDILLTQQYHDQIARYLPFSQYNRDGVTHHGDVVVRSKSGFMFDSSGAVRVDAGIVEVRDGGRWALCLMTEGHPDTGFGPEHPGAILNGHISRLIFNAWSGRAGLGTD
jgi:beta-lactamase class A